MNIKQPNKPRKCNWISKKSWETLNIKEKDYIILLHCKKLTKEKIMRKIYIFDRSYYHKFITRVRDKIKDDVEKLKNSKF